MKFAEALPCILAGAAYARTADLSRGRVESFRRTPEGEAELVFARRIAPGHVSYEPWTPSVADVEADDWTPVSAAVNPLRERKIDFDLRRWRAGR